MRTNTGQILYIPKIGQRADFQHPLMKGCVGWWPLNDGGGDIAKDLSGNENDGTQSGGVTWASTAKGTAASFDGVNDYLEGNNNLSVLESQVGTVSVWFKLDSSALDNPGDILLNISDGSGSANRLDVIAGRIGYAIPDSSIAASFVWGGTSFLISCYDNGKHYLFDDQWHHFAYVVDAASNAMYLDGTSVTQSYYLTYGSSTTGNCFCNPTTSLDGVRLGARKLNGAYSNYTQGNIQNARVYSRALSSTEILELYTNPWTGLSMPSETRYFFFSSPSPTINPFSRIITSSTILNKSGKTVIRRGA